MTSNRLRESILVVAHPDDEALWFSSILREVNQIIICYSDELTNPEFGEKRKKSLLNFPLTNNSFFELTSIGVSRPQSFVLPKFNRYGIELIGKHNPVHKKKYEENYYELKKNLRHQLVTYQNVITHNPWGEYGHEEHVQIYRVVKNLQAEAGFHLWHSGYCSTRTINMIPQCMYAEDTITLPTDYDVANELMEHYKRYGCWTWDDNWCWPDKETLIKQKPFVVSGGNKAVENHFITRNSVIPLGLISMSPVSKQFRNQRLSMLKRVMSFARKIINRVYRRLS